MLSRGRVDFASCSAHWIKRVPLGLQCGLGHLCLSQLMMPLWHEAERLTALRRFFREQVGKHDTLLFVAPACLGCDAAPRNGSDFTFLRLHLVVVDMHRHWSPRHRGLGLVWQQLEDAAPYCTPIACCNSIAQKPHRNERYVFGYARDNSTFPVFLLSPVRRQQDFSLVALFTAAVLPLDTTPEIRILPLDHFYDAFRAVPMTSLRPAAGLQLTPPFH